MIYLILGVVIGLLVVSLVGNGVQLYMRRSSTRFWRDRAREADDAKKAAELRSAEQIDAMLDRVHTSKLTLDPVQTSPPVDPEARRYIPDTPDADENWNDFRQVPDEELETWR